MSSPTCDAGWFRRAPLLLTLLLSLLVMAAWGGEPLALGPPASRPAASFPAKEPLAEARRLFSEGIALRRAGDLEGALSRFRRAHVLHPSYKTHLNLATVLFELGQLEEAGALYERFFAEGAAQSPMAITAAARRRYQQLLRRVARVELTCDEARARVLVDGHEVGRTPLDTALYLLPGEHVLVLHASPRSAKHVSPREAHRRLSLVAGEQRVLAVSFGRPRARVAANRPARDLGVRASLRRRKTIVAWTALGTGAALAVGAAVLLGLGTAQGERAYQAYSQLSATDPDASFREERAAMSEARKRQVAGAVLAGAAVAVAALGAYHLFTRPAEPARGGVARDVAAGVAPLPGGAALSLGGSF